MLTSLPTALSEDEVRSRFRPGLFDDSVLSSYRSAYASSGPYKHAVISPLVSDDLLRAVRDEINKNVVFTPKETDIYRINQSGDLANLDGLDDESLARLPSLLRLRDALYSSQFRSYISAVTGCGPLSGRKTDMAINVYTPGCYLLCHDDVIGSRRVSYILYLTHPDQPWKPEWGGALRLFPVEEKDGGAKVPFPEPSLCIPPAWNQLSFFAVQPGLSFHDVEEVYHPARPAASDQGGVDEPPEKDEEHCRHRMAISGWFHIPQPGEEGFIEGEEERNAKNSSLAQLQGDPDQYDLPAERPVPSASAPGEADEEQLAFTASELDFLLRYLAPSYLTPDTLEGVAERFDTTCTISLRDVLSVSFAERLRAYIEGLEAKPGEPDEMWSVARPPHKHRFLFYQPRVAVHEAAKNGIIGPSSADAKKATAETQQNGSASTSETDDMDPLTELLTVLLPSAAFARWIYVATGGVCVARTVDAVARRFRRGRDYTLATDHRGSPRLELNLGITPTKGWGDEYDDDEEEEENEEAEGTSGEDGADGASAKRSNGKATSSAADAAEKPQANGTTAEVQRQPSEEPAKGGQRIAQSNTEADGVDLGGQEIYMAGDDEDEAQLDAAVYRAAPTSGDGEEGDDNVLFFQRPAWNVLTLVLRDSGALRFVKYVSASAPGDRWDVSAAYVIDEDTSRRGAGRESEEAETEMLDEGDVEVSRGGPAATMPRWDDSQVLLDESEEEEFKGFSHSEDSDSD